MIPYERESVVNGPIRSGACKRQDCRFTSDQSLSSDGTMDARSIPDDHQASTHRKPSAGAFGRRCLRTPASKPLIKISHIVCISFKASDMQDRRLSEPTVFNALQSSFPHLRSSHVPNKARIAMFSIRNARGPVDGSGLKSLTPAEGSAERRQLSSGGMAIPDVTPARSGKAVLSRRAVNFQALSHTVGHCIGRLF